MQCWRCHVTGVEKYIWMFKILISFISGLEMWKHGLLSIKQDQGIIHSFSDHPKRYTNLEFDIIKLVTMPHKKVLSESLILIIFELHKASKGYRCFSKGLDSRVDSSWGGRADRLINRRLVVQSLAPRSTCFVVSLVKTLLSSCLQCLRVRVNEWDCVWESRSIM